MHSQNLINEIKKLQTYKLYENDSMILINKDEVIITILKYFNENNLNNNQGFKFIIGD